MNNQYSNNAQNDLSQENYDSDGKSVRYRHECVAHVGLHNSVGHGQHVQVLYVVHVAVEDSVAATYERAFEVQQEISCLVLRREELRVIPLVQHYCLIPQQGFIAL